MSKKIKRYSGGRVKSVPPPLASDSVLITISPERLAAYPGGYKAMIEDWQRCNGKPNTWWFKMHYSPRIMPLYVYWVVGGRIRWRAKVADVLKNTSITFAGRDKAEYGKAWFVTFDFEQVPRRLQAELQGFGGIRSFESSLCKF